jgi:hypothetical protein
MKLTVQNRSNRGGGGGENLSQGPFVRHKTPMAGPGIEPGPSRWEAGDWPPEPWHGQLYSLF